MPKPSRKVIISCAVTGAIHTPSMSPHLPVTPEQIIDDSPEFQRVLDRNQLQGKCGRCRYKFTCGGCRAMALYENGDLMAEDPTCFFEPEALSERHAANADKNNICLDII